VEKSNHIDCHPSLQTLNIIFIAIISMLIGAGIVFKLQNAHYQIHYNELEQVKTRVAVLETRLNTRHWWNPFEMARK